MMTQQTIDFSQLAAWQQSASKNKALMRVLMESAQETLAGKITPLAMAFLETSVAAVYQKFGFSVFAPESRRLLALELARQTRIPAPAILEWLDHAAYQQLADFHVLRYVDAEPDWLELNQSFCISVIRRIVVCRPQEWNQVGLEHYPRELLELLLRVVDLQMLGMRQDAQIPTGFEVLLRAQGDHPFLVELLQSSLEQWGHAIDDVLTSVAEEALSLLAWRLEAFTTEKQLLCDARLAVHTLSEADIEAHSLRIIVLCILLSGYNFGTQNPIIAETPVTFSQLLKAVESFLGSGTESARLCANLLACGNEKAQLIGRLEEVLEMGEQLGVFKWAAIAKNQKACLLTSLAMQIVEPYRELIDSAFGEQRDYSQVPF